MVQMKKLLVVLTLVCFGFAGYAQDDVSYTMGYSTVKFSNIKRNFLRRYVAPGKEAVCGIYSSYNKVLYNCDGTQLKVENNDYIYEALGPCCTEMMFNDGPRPYAMFSFTAEIIRVDYETNTIYARADGADIVIETFNTEIDAWYKKYGKRESLVPLRVNLVLRNWHYTPESEDSYATNTKKYRKKAKFKKKANKNDEKYIHESEYMK
ncbi:MAG: hypothetical protein RL660_2097 [Bacteroidota bacterium]